MFGGFSAPGYPCSVYPHGAIQWVGTRYLSHRMSGRNQTSKTLEISYRWSNPRIYRGFPPKGQMGRCFLYKIADAREIMVGIRMDVRAGGSLPRSEASIAPGAPVICEPPISTAEKLPDRTTSTEKRPISDSRFVNARCDKHDYPKATTPRLGEIITRIWMLKRHRPGVPAKPRGET